MPQELALYGEFTIKETLQYFGRYVFRLLFLYRIFNMTPEWVVEWTHFLLQFLDLSDYGVFSFRNLQHDSGVGGGADPLPAPVPGLFRLCCFFFLQNLQHDPSASGGADPLPPPVPGPAPQVAAHHESQRRPTEVRRTRIEPTAVPK